MSRTVVLAGARWASPMCTAYRAGVPLDDGVRARLTPFRDVAWGTLFADPALRAAYDEAFAGAAGYVPPAPRISDEHIDGPIGPLRVRVYQPSDDRNDRPVLVWAHGGGFVGGSIDMREADMVGRETCSRAGAVVVSVDYHLAGGEVSYPSLHREVLSALDWVRATTHRLGVDPSRLTLGGASAGANLAIAATLELRTRGDVLPAALALAYPLLHRRVVRSPDIDGVLAQLPQMLRFDSETIDFMFGVYLGGVCDTPYASVERNELAGLPPCLVIVAEHDDLRPSGEQFASDARRAGVDVDLYVARGMPHGHLNMAASVPETDASLQLLGNFVSRARVHT